MQDFRVKQGYEKQIELVRLLCDNGFPIAASTLRKYESGEREIPGGFAYHAARLLELDETEIQCLLDAVIHDRNLSFLKEFNEEGKRHQDLIRQSQQW